jgi:hypothetical protein
MPLNQYRVAFVTQLLSTGRFIANQFQPRNATAFLIDRNDRFDPGQISQIIDQFAKLMRSPDVPAEKNEPSRLNFSEDFCSLRVNLRTGHPNK